MPEAAEARLLARVQSDLDTDHLALTGVEQELVDRAVATAGLIAKLEQVIEEHGVTTKGHRGLIVSPAVTELRHQSILLKSLLAGVKIASDDAADAKTKQNRSNAATRWSGRGVGT